MGTFQFTFYYSSIKGRGVELEKIQTLLFTFYYSSIKGGRRGIL